MSKDKHRRHRAYDELERRLQSRFDCVSREAVAEERREGRKATSREARIARNRAAQKLQKGTQ